MSCQGALTKICYLSGIYDVMTRHNYIMLSRPNDVLCYILGAFITDGCITKNGKYSWTCSLISQDLDWMELVRDFICPDLTIKNYNNGGNVLWITNKNIAEWFMKNNCIPRKSMIVKTPDIPIKNMPDFLRGCWDGDGCISSYTKRNGSITYSSYLCSASHIFLKETASFLKKNNIACSICEVNKKSCQINGRDVIPQNPHYRLCLGSRATYQLVKLLYYPNHKISMPRKLQKANDVIAHYQNLA